jgi:hypothetical protein
MKLWYDFAEGLSRGPSMFKDDETPEQVAVRVSRELRDYMTRNGMMSIDMTVTGYQIALRSPSGSTLSITCNGTDEFRLEEDAPSVSGFRNQQRRWAGTRQNDHELERCVKLWLSEQPRAAA